VCVFVCVCVCVHVCLSLASLPHYCMDPDVTWGKGRGCLLVVHYWADLQSVHGFRCCENMSPNAKCQRVLVLALSLVDVLSRHHRRRRLVIDAMKGAIGLSQDVMMRGRDWLTNTKRREDEDERPTKRRKRPSLYGKATVEEIRADYETYAECLTAKKNLYLANIDEPNSLINFIYLDSYEAQQLPCTAWYTILRLVDCQLYVVTIGLSND